MVVVAICSVQRRDIDLEKMNGILSSIQSNGLYLCLNRTKDVILISGKSITELTF